MIQVVHRVCDILELMAQDIDREFRLGEIADALGLHHATCANILRTLIDRGYVTKVYPHKSYTLGPMIYQLPRRRNYRRTLVRAARPVMAELAESTGESVVLAILENSRCYIIDEVRSATLPAAAFDPLYIRDLTGKATARVLLAYLEPAERQLILTDPAPSPDFAAIRGEPVHRHDDDQTVGLAAPVWQDGRVIAALGLYMPRQRYLAPDAPQFGQVLLAGAIQLSQVLAEER